MSILLILVKKIGVVLKISPIFGKRKYRFVETVRTNKAQAVPMQLRQKESPYVPDLFDENNQSRCSSGGVVEKWAENRILRQSGSYSPFSCYSGWFVSWSGETVLDVRKDIRQAEKSTRP